MRADCKSGMDAQNQLAMHPAPFPEHNTGPPPPLPLSPFSQGQVLQQASTNLCVSPVARMNNQAPIYNIFRLQQHVLNKGCSTYHAAVTQAAMHGVVLLS